jgi:L-fucose isomerase
VGNDKTDKSNRLKGRLPKIGIRPTIDGRRKGVRESLEGQTMSMARSAADFLSKNLKHSNGMHNSRHYNRRCGRSCNGRGKI